MVFIDFDNFKGSIKRFNGETGQNRYIDFYKINKFITDYLSNNQQYENEKMVHIRTYFYTGEYTESLIWKLSNTLEHLDTDKKEEFKKYIEETKQKREKQRELFNTLNKYYFFEVRKKPLQFSRFSKRIFQKGIDVQIAVDLVSNAYIDNYDIAVLFSGDIDLLESLKTIKSLGKNVIILSHKRNIAKEMIKQADFYIDIRKLHDDVLDLFTHEYQTKIEEPIVLKK